MLGPARRGTATMLNRTVRTVAAHTARTAPQNTSVLAAIGMAWGHRGISFKMRKPDFSKLKLKQQPPGHIVGTVNDAYVAPPADYAHGSYHWAYEKITTVAMVPMAISPFLTGATTYPLLDAVFGTLLVVHCKAGFESCIVDYIPKRVYGVWHNVAMWALNAGTALALYGVFLLETTSNGLFDFIVKIWAS